MLYVKDNEGILENLENRFVYEVAIYLKYNNIFCMINNKLYSSEIEIPNIIRCFRVNNYISIYCDLYAAPKEWLENNNFVLYIKKPRNEKQKDVPNKPRSSRTSSKTTSTRAKKL